MIHQGQNAVVGGRAVARASADQSITSNTTLANATNLAFAVAANEEWAATFNVILGDGLGTTGVKLAVTTPAGATQQIDASWIGLVSPTTATDTYATTTTSGAALDFTSAGMGNVGGKAMMRVTVWVLNGATPGNVQLQIAQSTSSVSALILRKGSHLVAERI